MYHIIFILFFNNTNSLKSELSKAFKIDTNILWKEHHNENSMSIMALSTNSNNIVIFMVKFASFILNKEEKILLILTYLVHTYICMGMLMHAK